jgi:hypothetical protein
MQPNKSHAMNPPPKRRRSQENDSSATSTNRSDGSGRHSNPTRYKNGGRSRNNRHREYYNRHGTSHASNSNELLRGTDSETTSLTASSTTVAESPSETELHWPNPSPHYIPLSEEERMLPALVHWGKSERGMMKDQPPFRLQKILKLLGTNGKDRRNNKHSYGKHKNSNNLVQINLLQSLSLRRHHLKLLNPTLSMPALRLGSNADIRISADLFEQCIETHLTKLAIQFWNEKDQKRMHEENGVGRQPLTPDFRIKNGSLKLLLTQDTFVRTATDDTVCETQTIFWIEAKMFYGASTIPHDTDNAVGTILPKARQYVSYYGPGAIVFMYGCGAKLARELKEIGVIALDCRGVDLERVFRHQIGWCGDGKGNVLF